MHLFDSGIDLYQEQAALVLVSNDCYSFLDLNPLPDDKILDWSKLKQIADDTL